MSLLKNSPVIRSEALIENQARWASPSELAELSRALTDLLEEQWRRQSGPFKVTPRLEEVLPNILNFSSKLNLGSWSSRAFPFLLEEDS